MAVGVRSIGEVVWLGGVAGDLEVGEFLLFGVGEVRSILTGDFLPPLVFTIQAKHIRTTDATT